MSYPQYPPQRQQQQQYGRGNPADPQRGNPYGYSNGRPPAGPGGPPSAPNPAPSRQYGGYDAHPPRQQPMRAPPPYSREGGNPGPPMRTNSPGQQQQRGPRPQQAPPSNMEMRQMNSRGPPPGQAVSTNGPVPSAGQPRNPYQVQNSNPYSSQSGNPYSGQPSDPYSGQNSNPYARPTNGPDALPLAPTPADASKSPSPSAPPPPMQPPHTSNTNTNTNNTTAILNQCASIKAEIATLNTHLATLQTLQSRSLNSPDPRGPTTELDALTTSITATYKTQLASLTALKRDPSAATNPAAKSHIAATESSLRQTWTRYQTLEAAFRKRAVDAAERQYRIVRPDAPETEVKAACADLDASAGGSQVFAQALLQGQRRDQAQSALGAVRGRHEAIAKIERDMVELAGLFEQLAETVAAQEVAVQKIEADSADVHQNTVAAVTELGHAEVSARKARKKKWICFGIAVVLVIVAIIAVAIALHSVGLF